MSENEKKPAPPAPDVPSSDSQSPPEKSKVELIVRGGTTSSAWDKEQAKKVADAERRRKEQDEDRKIASIPIEQGGGKMYSHHFADPMFMPRIHVVYVNEKKEPMMDMLCELVQDDTSGDDIFQFICPECVKRGVHSGEAQCTARNTHRKWHLDTREAGKIKHVETVDLVGNPKLQPYLCGGTIMDTDVLICPNYNCGAKYKIHKNMMYRVY